MPSHCTRRVLEKLALGGKLLVALVGASVVGEQMWENDLPSLPCLLAGEQQRNVGAYSSLGVIEVEFRSVEKEASRESRKAQNVDESGLRKEKL